MCLKVVIEDHVENTKFSQEKLKKGAFSSWALIATSIPFQSIKFHVLAKISNVKKLITCSFELKLKLRSV